MLDRPIIFSAPMVRALLAGRKTQTRRLASSPLARCAPGDRLYVREGFAIEPSGLGPVRVIYAADHADAQLDFTGDPDRIAHADRLWTEPEHNRPSIHMPRWTSRLTLVVEAVRVEPLQVITWDDARAEGLDALSKDGKLVKYGIADRDGLPGNDDDGWHWQDWNVDPTAAFVRLWSSLHTRAGERWEDNPDVVALTFRVVRGNIDQETP